ncbi:Rf4p protein [Monosporozyma servazzii]
MCRENILKGTLEKTTIKIVFQFSNMYLDNFTNDYAKMCMSAYCADFECFIKYYDVTKLIEIDYELDMEECEDYNSKYKEFIEDDWKILVIYERLNGNYDKNKLNNLHLLTYILSYTCRHNFIFAYQLTHSVLELNEIVYEAISASFIQHGYLDDDFIKIYKPLNIWYSKHPSKETCLKLLKKHDFYKYSVAYLSVIMGWEDIFIKANIDCGFQDLYFYAIFFHRDKIIKILKKYPIILDNVYSRSKIYIKYKNYDKDFIWDSFDDLINKWNKHKLINDDVFINYNYRLEFNHASINIHNIRVLGLNYKLIKNNIQLINKKLPFIFPNKYVAYIGDIQYYQGGDFEYAKWGALNNPIFANYVIDNIDEFPDYVIRNAISNRLINGVINKKLVNKYKPFYFYNFICIHGYDYINSLIDKFPFLKINIMFSNINRIYVANIDKYLLPDIDLINIMYNNSFYDYANSLVNQAEEQGYYYKHLDFENECNYDEPKKIPFDSVNLNDFKNQPLAIFQEGLTFADFTSINS